MPSWKKVIISGSDAELNSLNVSNGITGSLHGTASYALNSDLLDGRDSSVFATTGSNIFIGNQTVTGSLFTTGSNTLIGSTTLTGSLNITGSTLQVGNNTLLGNTLLSGSITISGSSSPGSPTASVQIYGDIQQAGYHRFDPVTTNIDTSISASYIFVSGSTNDLYFAQNGNNFSNVTRLRWLEGNLYTGLLHGGLITANTGSTTFNLNSGSGVVVDLNASLTDNPYPIITYVNWGNFTSQPLTYLTSSIQTYIGIDSSGQITQQTTPYISGEYNSQILIGTVLHQNQTTVNASITYPNVAYGYKQRTYDFIKAFGPLKLSGLNIITSSSLELNVSSGTAFADGRNYQIDPNNPSYITDPGTTVSKIFRYYQSGSGFVQDTNGGVGYTVIDPGNYNPNSSGSLEAVPGTGANRQWSIQRVFWYPNSATKGIVVYYGTQTYANEIDAAANISYEQFQEVENTKQNAVYLGALVLRNDAVFTNASTYRILSGGIFRNVGGSGGGGNITSLLLSQLGDVAISGPTDLQALTYNGTSLKWENSSFISASISGNAATATSASFATTASFAQTASFVQTAQTASFVQIAQTASYVQNAQTASYVLNAISSSFATSASYAVTASYAEIFPYTGSAVITGSLVVTGSVKSTTVQSNIFINSQNITDTIYVPSGSNALIIGPVDISEEIVVEGGGNLYITDFTNPTPNLQAVTDVGSTTTNSITAANFITTSDKRLKSKIKAIKNPFKVLKGIKSYEYIKDGKQDAGFIAQEVQETIPYAVFENKEGMLTMSDRPMLAYLYAAVMELKQENEKLKKELKSIKP